MQVKPLAQVLIGYAQGHKLTQKWTGPGISRVPAISKKQVTPAMLQSTLGRIAARAIRASMFADLADKHWDLLVKKSRRGSGAASGSVADRSLVWLARFVPSIRKGRK